MIDAEGVGSTHSASKLVYGLVEAGHEVTVYCRGGTSPPDAIEAHSAITVKTLDTGDESRFVPWQRFGPIGECLLDRASEFEKFDVLHSYVSAISSLGKIRDRISTPVVTSLNGYGPVCPKKDLYYMDAEPCRTNGKSRCTRCILNSTVFPDQSGVYDGVSVFEKYSGAKRLPATVYLLTKRLRSLQTVLAIREAADKLDAYHVQSDHLKEVFAPFDFPIDRFYTVPNILDEQFLVPHESDFEEPYRLLYVGNLLRKKGVQKLLPVIEYLDSHYDTEYELTIVGGGYLRPYLEREAKNKQVNVTVTGRLPYDELASIYASHDVFVYPGIWEEPFARVFLEALAAGTPIVGSAVGDLDQIVGNAGLVTDSSVQGIARGIQELVETGELEKRSQAAKRQVERYRPSEVLPQLEQMYQEAISGTTGDT